MYRAAKGRNLLYELHCPIELIPSSLHSLSSEPSHVFLPAFTGNKNPVKSAS